MMTGIERVVKVIKREPGAPVARGELTVDRGFAMDLLNWRFNGAVSDGVSDTDLIIACCRTLRLDLVCIQSGEMAGNEERLSIKPTDVGSLVDEGLFVFWVVDGAFQRAMTKQGMMALLMDIARSPGDVGKDIREIADQVMTTMAQGVSAGAHGIILADDIAYHQGTYMAPGFVEQFLLPIWQMYVKTAKGLGVPVFFHSDGNLNTVLPNIVSAGFDGLQCIEPAAGMSMSKIRQQYGKDLCLMGNVDPALLSDQGGHGNAELGYDELRRAVTDLMAPTVGSGGFIFGSCSGLHTGMWPERVNYMYQLATELDRAACCDDSLSYSYYQNFK